MKTKNQLSQLLGTALALMVFFLYAPEVAYAQVGGSGNLSGGCFASDTSILTPEGYQPISQLSRGSQIIGYSLSNHQPETGIVVEIQEGTATEYYMINDAIKVTSTSLFYTIVSEEIKQVEVRQLKIGDQLVGEESSRYISSLQHIYARDPITVYNLISFSPNHNFYAGSGFLVHNKHCTNPTPGKTLSWDQPLPSFKVVLFVLMSLIPAAFLGEIYNFIRLRGKQFTNDGDLIEYTQAVAPLFTNRYSVGYRHRADHFGGDVDGSGSSSYVRETPLRLWDPVPLKSAINPQQYRHLLSEQELLKNMCRIFSQYQQNWMNKNFTAMKQYVDEWLYTQRSRIFQFNYDESIDIIYRPEVVAIAPLSFSEEQDQHFFEVQINARMTNFVVSQKGYVIRGKPYPRSLTEYWTLKLDSEKNWWVTEISPLYFPRNFSK